METPHNNSARYRRERQTVLFDAIVDSGISYRRLAKMAGCDRTWLSELARGLRPNVQLRKAMAVARALGLPVDDLFADINEEG